MNDEQPLSAILVIEPYQAVREGLVTLFETLELPVYGYADATGCLASEHLNAAGCIISAARLPDGDAAQLQRKLHDRRLTVPLIVMSSGKSEASLVTRARALGPVTVVTKPLVNSQLMLEVCHLLAH